MGGMVAQQVLGGGQGMNPMQMYSQGMNPMQMYSQGMNMMQGGQMGGYGGGYY